MVKITGKIKNTDGWESKSLAVAVEDRNPLNINIKDVTINVFGDDYNNWRVDVVHKPTGIKVSENSQIGIHRNRRLAMQRLSEELKMETKD